MAEGVDYAWQRPTIAGLVAAGKKFAFRYVGPGSDGKHLDPAEAQALSAAGIPVVANAEGAADGLRNGWATGAGWARSGHDHAVRCGMPPDRPIYLSVDFDATAAVWPKVADALRGAGSVLGPDRVGVYGGYRTIAWAVRDGVATWYWQTYAWSRWADPDGVTRLHWHPAAHCQQYRNGVLLAGGNVDLNRSMAADFGQWTTGDAMALTDDEIKRVAAAAAEAVLARRQEMVDAVLTRGLGSSGVPTVGVALQTGAYRNTEALLAKVDALAAKVDAFAGLSEAQVRALVREEVRDALGDTAEAAAVAART